MWTALFVRFDWTNRKIIIIRSFRGKIDTRCACVCVCLAAIVCRNVKKYSYFLFTSSLHSICFSTLFTFVHSLCVTYLNLWPIQSHIHKNTHTHEARSERTYARIHIERIKIESQPSCAGSGGRPSWRLWLVLNRLQIFRFSFCAEFHRYAYLHLFVEFINSVVSHCLSSLLMGYSDWRQK